MSLADRMRFIVILLLLALLAACNSEGSSQTDRPGVGSTAHTTATLIPTAVEPSETSIPLETPATPEIATPEMMVEKNDEPTPGPVGDMANDFPWWNDVVFYEIFVRSFQDSDGDGVGDLNGLIERLDYLNDGDPTTNSDLGIKGIWLMPIMESPSYHGYDVIDYFNVDEEYGTEEDFKRLIAEAHARGIKVIIDLVINHTGRDHPWFQESLAPNSERRDWYVWSDENPGYPGPDGQRVWHPNNDDYYYGVFWDGMPDLNLTNPAVTETIYNISQYWLEEMDVDGFRLDAIKHLIEDGRLQQNTPATHAWLQDYFIMYKGVNGEAFTVGEAWTGTQQVLDYTGDEVDIAFQFDLAEAIVKSSREGIGTLLSNTQEEVVSTFPPGQYATFITNHDQNRAMSQLRGNEGAAKIAASMLLTSPGVPFIYYGEEIGLMGEKPDEDIRRPMQWSAEDPGAGFSEGQPWRPPYEDFTSRNVVNQDGDPNSLLNHYRQLIKLRNNHSSLSMGSWELIDTKPGRLYAFLRHYEDETMLILLNPSKNPVDDYQLNLTESNLRGEVQASLLLGEGLAKPPALDELGGFMNYAPVDSLPPYSTFVIGLSPINS